MLRSILLTLSVLCALLAACDGQPREPGSMLAPDSILPIPGSNGCMVSYTLNVTLAYGAPSCFARPIVLTSGVFGPAIAVHQGDTLKITLVNNLPVAFPSVTDGISIHYHGLQMAGSAAYFDGMAYVSLCPVAPGKSYTYQFLVNDPPGTYLWHDHSAGFKGDGLEGPLIVYPPRLPGAPPAFPPLAVSDLWSYDGEHTLLLTDWYHASTNSLLFQLNMPFDAARVTNDTGAWSWIGMPQAILINGRGFYGDCQLFPGSGGNSAPPTCMPSTFTVPPGRSPAQPWASNNNPGCTHSQFTVEPGKTFRLRLVNAATLVFMTICFEGHNVTLIAADAIPTAPISTRCLDLNSGQRLDVLLTADQPPANYWITVAPQYRIGAPAGYAVLNYKGVNTSTFPSSPPPQPVNITPWGFAEDSLVRLSPRLLTASSDLAVNLYLSPGEATLAPPPVPTKIVLVNLSQPLLEANGQLRWALNNVAMTRNPPCVSLLSKMQKYPKFLKQMAVNASTVNGTGAGPFVGISYVKAKDKMTVYYDGISPAPLYPSVGLHLVENAGGEVVDVVVNNFPANSFNGDYRPVVGPTRTAVEQHPMHLHGHRFWVLGRGSGAFNASAHAAGLNTVNPPYRDTVTVTGGGWVYLRFKADNPGIWPFHCHLLPHVFMGQQLYFVEDIANAAPPPSKVPKCPATCQYNFAPYTKAFLRSKWGMSGWELPPLY
ncbi:hypothetical protein Vretimale_1452 [Volvox reticuliferus]|uniref:Laccase n=1 Tax=Volvox reticuliferus TaxID=1737510 RepID=A0A8J4CGD7_9CHLO|nr:hypothetical protein Vretifemale_10906 [Volvox reticuliferus]GIL95529.1 hypothetical protein Vretimale_1452 [Volvox reticuliferus]